MSLATAAHCAWREAIDAVLADGEWHDVEDVIAAGAAAVPPGVAYREGEKNRQSQRQRRGNGAGDRVRGRFEDSVATGARRKAQRLLAVLIRRGRLERDGNLVRLSRPPIDTQRHESLTSS